MAQIPISADVAAVVGSFGEGIENRSLLLDKFVFHKLWPVEYDDRNQVIKWDDATRWSFIRIADQAQELLMAESTKLAKDAKGGNITPENAEKKRSQASIARRLANIKWNTVELEEWRAKHSRNFVRMLQKAMPERHVVVVGQLEGRLAINLSDSLVQNAGIALDRLFGMPYIPGSAVKGVCRHAALAELKSITDNQERKRMLSLFQQVFGTSEVDFKHGGQLQKFVALMQGDRKLSIKGRVDFLSAHPVTPANITVDLTTVHYPDYYRSGRTEDLSKEKPRPNPFPVVERGARFAFCLVVNRLEDDIQQLLAAARRWLELALTEGGIGAKTGSGYGWFSLPKDGLQQIEEAERLAEERKAAEQIKQREREEATARAEEARRAEEERIKEKRAEEERRKTMTPESIADEEVAGWNDDAFRARLRNFIRAKGGPSEELKRAMVRALRSNRSEIWNKWKEQATRGDAAKVADAVRALSRSMSLGKMP